MEKEKLEISCKNLVEENLIFHGASIVFVNVEDVLDGGFYWDTEFLQDISIMWDLCCRGIYDEYHNNTPYPNLCNRVIGCFAELDNQLQCREDMNVLKVNKYFFYNIFIKEKDVNLFESYVSAFYWNFKHLKPVWI